MCANLKIVILFIVIVSFLSDFVYAIPKEYPSCRTRDTCIRLTECRSYMNLMQSLRRPLSPSAVLFLRRQECGFDGTFPMVCCFPTDTAPTQVFNTNINLSAKEDDLNHPQANPGKNNGGKSIMFPVSQNDYSLAGISGDTTSTTTTTTEKVKTTTRLSRRRVNHLWNLPDYMNPSSTQRPKKDAKVKNEEDLKNKMDAINHAFAHSTVDYFFVRRTLDRKN